MRIHLLRDCVDTTAPHKSVSEEKDLPLGVFNYSVPVEVELGVAGREAQVVLLPDGEERLRGPGAYI